MVKFQVVAIGGGTVDGWFDPAEVAAIVDLKSALYTGRTEIVLRSGKKFAVMETVAEVLAVVRERA